MLLYRLSEEHQIWEEGVAKYILRFNQPTEYKGKKTKIKKNIQQLVFAGRHRPNY